MGKALIGQSQYRGESWRAGHVASLPPLRRTVNPSHFTRRFRAGLSAITNVRYDPGMTILLPAQGTAFAAFCVWLTVRIVNRRERWAKWTLAGAFIAFLHIMSLARPAGFAAGKRLRQSFIGAGVAFP